ncbi:hypothetical protein OL548_18425 [Lysinibacillus sp. MHQ-1]|nr:hypothetical protein OL548_18425 [Lysinibacillus sp. MHQ-1]
MIRLGGGGGVLKYRRAIGGLLYLQKRGSGEVKFTSAKAKKLKELLGIEES